MKDWKTTIIGALLASAVAVQPFFSGEGWHFDKPTIIRLSIAALIAFLGYLTKDADKKETE